MGTNITPVSLEHRFWLQILGDHARFAFRFLAPSEQGAIRRAEQLINEFDGLLMRSRQSQTPDELKALNRQAHLAVKNLKHYQLEIIHQQLTGEIAIGMSPTLLNHMINELEEYETILKCLLKGQEPPQLHVIHYHLIWLLDAQGHASAIEIALDNTERPLIEMSRSFTNRFRSSYEKAFELKGYLRTSLVTFPALERFNIEMGQLMRQFMAFLQELEQLQTTKEVLGTLNPLFPDHMLREECYYLHKISSLSQVEAPNCDPTKPRSVERP